jgi:hypothetical protein
MKLMISSENGPLESKCKELGSSFWIASMTNYQSCWEKKPKVNSSYRNNPVARKTDYINRIGEDTSLKGIRKIGQKALNNIFSHLKKTAPVNITLNALARSRTNGHQNTSLEMISPYMCRRPFEFSYGKRLYR